MPDKTKTAKELAELAAEQGEHAAKNLAAAGEKSVGNLLPQIPMGEEGFAFQLRISNKTLIIATVAAGTIYSTKLGSRLWEAKKARDVRKAQAKVVRVDEPRDRKAG